MTAMTWTEAGLLLLPVLILVGHHEWQMWLRQRKASRALAAEQYERQRRLRIELDR
jgi:hypothetical protein